MNTHTANNEQKYRNFYEFIATKDKVCVRGDKLQHMDDEQMYVGFSGHRYIHAGFTEPEFEWSHKDIRNLYAALSR